MYQNGVKLSPADYTATSGTTVVLAQGASADDIVEVLKYDTFAVADTVSAKDGGGFGGNISSPIVTATTSVKTPLIEFTDGDDAITIADGGGVTLSSTLGVTGAVTANAGVSIDNITIDGTEIDLSSGDLTIDSAGDIILDAADSITTPTAGTSNVKLGDNAGNSIQSGGNYNILLGDEAGTSITTGDSNIAIGHGAGDALTTGTNNVAIGHLALSAEDEHGDNTAVGYQALLTLNAGAAGYNIGIGAYAGKEITTGIKRHCIYRRNG